MIQPPPVVPSTDKLLVMKTQDFKTYLKRNSYVNTVFLEKRKFPREEVVQPYLGNKAMQVLE